MNHRTIRHSKATCAYLASQEELISFLHVHDPFLQNPHVKTALISSYLHFNEVFEWHYPTPKPFTFTSSQ